MACVVRISRETSDIFTLVAVTNSIILLTRDVRRIGESYPEIISSCRVSNEYAEFYLAFFSFNYQCDERFYIALSEISYNSKLLQCIVLKV